MGRDGKQRLCQFADLRHQKIVDILAGDQDGGVLLADTLHGVADIFNRRIVGCTVCILCSRQVEV